MEKKAIGKDGRTIPVPGDGSCQYHSMVKALKVAGYKSNHNVKSLRTLTASELSSGEHGTYAPFYARGQ